LRDRKLFPLLDKAVAVNLLRVLQPLSGVVLFGLLLNLLRNVGQLLRLKKLRLILEDVPLILHQKLVKV
jgi:hypothetical protein